MRIVKITKLMSLSVLVALATGATAVAQSSSTGDTRHVGFNESSEVASTSGTDNNLTQTDATDDSTATNDVNDNRSANRGQAVKASHEARLTAVKLKVCENRQNGIKNTMSRIADRGQKQLNLFSTIATKTETFYANKGKTLSTYDSLVAAVNDKKAVAQTTVDTVKADSANFNCDNTDPQGSIATFKTALKSEIQALKDYKTAVKNLIVGVKSVQSTEAPTTETN